MRNTPSKLHAFLRSEGPDLLLEPHKLLLLEADELLPLLEECGVDLGDVARLVLEHHLERVLGVERDLRLAFNGL